MVINQNTAVGVGNEYIVLTASHRIFLKFYISVEKIVAEFYLF